MYLKVSGVFADGELVLLTDLLELLDAKLAGVREQIASHRDPESVGLTDRREYIIGVALCAVQQYLVDTLTFTGLSKTAAFKVGPIRKGANVISALNAGANWWKHSAEWWSAGKVPASGEWTFKFVESIVDGSTDYALANLLAELLDSSRPKLVELVPLLIDWRAEVDRLRRDSRSMSHESLIGDG